MLPLLTLKLLALVKSSTASDSEEASSLRKHDWIPKEGQLNTRRARNSGERMEIRGVTQAMRSTRVERYDLTVGSVDLVGLE